MKKKITLLSLLAFLFFMTDVWAQCITGTKWPATNYASLNNGSIETITTSCRPEEYAAVSNIQTTRSYTFSSSVPTDYITITNINKEVIAHGPSGLVYTPTSTGVIFYYIHTNTQCGTNDINRTRYISSALTPTCGTPTTLAVSNMTSNSCKLSWTAPSSIPGSGYEVVVNTTNLTPTPAATPTRTSTTNSIEVLDGLNPATNYYYWVRSNCGSQKGIWVYGGGFRTVTASTTGCNGATYGLYPQNTFTPACSGNAEQIAANSWAGQYTNVNVSTDKDYTFSSSVPTDYITITNTDGSVVYANGVTPLNWASSAVSGVVRYYLHSNASCGDQNTNRIKSITCATSACGLPSNLVVSNITSNSCRIVWTAPAVLPSAGYEIYLRGNNIAPTANTTATATASTNRFNPLNGLEGDTTYYYWIRSVCGTNKSAWVAGGSFTTNPSLGCNGAYYGLYPEATFTPAGTGAAEQIAANSWAGQYTNVNIVPNKQYTFSSSVTNDYITITNEAGNVVYATGRTPITWPSNTTSGVIRYYLSNDGNLCVSQATNRVRSITCASVPTSCAWPVGVKASSITSNSALISWTSVAPYTVSNYYIHVSSSPINAPNGTTTTTGGNTLNGKFANQLQPNTTYYFYVQLYCGNGVYSPWVSGGSFKTLAEIYLSCNGAFYGMFPLETYTPQCTGSLELITNSSAAGQYSNVNLSADKQYTFQTDTSTDYITITNEAGTAVLAKGSSPMTWNSGAFSGVARYYVHTQVACGISNSTRNKYIKCTSACIAPTAPSSYDINARFAKIQWSGNASSYQYYYGTSATAPANNYPTTDNVTTVRNATLTDLQPNVTYYFWVRSVCSGTSSAWVAGGNFTTLAGGCLNGNLYPNNSFTPVCNGGPEVVTSQAYAGQYSSVNLTANTTYKFESSVATDYITITNDQGTVLYAHGITPLTWSSGATTGAVRFYFHTDTNCGTQQVFRTKSITCVAPYTCGLPTNIAVSNITSNSVKYSYTAPATDPTVGYQLYATTTNTAPLSSVPAAANSVMTYGNVSGLAPNTTYYSWVRSICLSGAGLWVAGPSFTTIPAATTGCNGAVNGLWPLETFTPACNENAEIITASAFTGQYSNVNISDFKQYTFTSSVATDYITITNQDGTVTYASGVSPLNWNSGATSGIARYYLNTNASCGVTTAERTKSIKCVAQVCDAVSTVTPSNITSNSVRLQWSTSATAASYQYYVSTQNVAPTGSVSTLNSNRIELQNLNPATVYYYWVRVNCAAGLNSAWKTGSFTMAPALQCNGTSVPSGSSGLYPENTFTPAGTGNPEAITSSTWAGEYSNITIVPNKTYIFISSVATDHITITNADGTSVLASGITPVTWSSVTISGTVRYFIHTNASCGGTNVARTRSIICMNPCTAPIVPNFDQVPAICSGNTLTPLSTRSTNGISGTWAPALNNTVTTTYTFTPALGQCASVTTMTITVNAPSITPVFTQVGPVCRGNQFRALPVDSTNGIHGSWSPALNPNATTTYTFTPAPGQCATTTTMTIAVTDTPSIIPIFTQLAPICSGDNSNGLPPYSNNGDILGSWSPAFNNTATTTYTFTPTPGQCALPTTMTVEVRNPNIVPTFTQVGPICRGNQFGALPEDSNNGINGSWSPALNFNATTTYTFTPYPGQCAVPTTMTIVINSTPSITPTFTPMQPICYGENSNGLPPFSNNDIIGTWSPAFNNTATTTYTFTPNAGQCALPTTMTVEVRNPNIVPTFTQVGPICRGSQFGALPVDSNNGIHGSWSPALNFNTTTTYTFTPYPGQCAATTTMTIVINSTPFITPTFTPMQPICSGDNSNGLPPFSNNDIIGTWSPAFNNTVTTTYTFTPNAGQCALPATMTVEVRNPNIVPTFTQVGPICRGYQFGALPEDSNNGINGSWSPALNFNQTTTYTFTPYPGQCAVPTTMTIVINSTPFITPTFTPMQPICSGENSNGLPPFSNNDIIGTWSPAFNNTATTTYTFTPNAGQCALPATMTVEVRNPNITPTFTQVGPICEGFALAPLPVDSRNGIHGSWSPALNNDVTTTYTFTPYPGQCAIPTTMTIVVNQTCYNVNRNGNTVTAADISNARYQWYKCNPAPGVLIPGATSQSYTVTEPGDYRVVISVPGNNDIISNCVTISALDIKDVVFSNALKIYPNPNTGQFVVETTNQIAEKITVIDNLGRVIKTVAPRSFSTTLNIESFAEGVYFVKIATKGNETTKKIILKK